MQVGPVIEGLLRLLSPERCAACDEPLRPAERGFCGGCAGLVEPVRASSRRPTAAHVYGGPLADAIARFKYGGRTDLAPLLGGMLVPAALTYAGEVDCVMPMPLHPRQLRRRGFNQAALLAAPVASALGVAMDVGDLRRLRDTPSQAGLARRARMSNVRGAFAAEGRRACRVLLIDDVRTTGATFSSAASVLLRAGHRSVQTLALARADP